MMVEPEVTTKRLIVGCGYLGLRVGQIWRDAGDAVYPLTRKRSRFEWFRKHGWFPLLGDLCGALPTWPRVDTALLAVGFDRSAEHSIEDVYVGGVERLIETLPDDLGRLIYISSTGVYGSGGGETLNEQNECHPDRPGGAACLAAEERLRASPFADRTIILRLAGIYGPDRIPRRQALSSGDPIPADPDGYLNLIHVDDAAAIVARVTETATAPNLYCVSDGAPCRRGDFLTLAAELMRLPKPTFTPPEPGVSRRGGDKRIDPSKLYGEVPITLRYPSYRQGLRDSV